VMPAIEPGWEDLCRCRRRRHRAGSPTCFPPLFLLRDSRPSCRIAVADSAAAHRRTRAPPHARSNAHRRTRAPLHARPLGERQGRAFGPIYPCTEAVDPLAAPPRLLPRGCLSARAQGKGRAFRVPRVILAPSKHAPLDAAGSGRLFPSVAVNANLSSAMAEPSCAAGLRSKSPDLWNVLASPVSHAYAPSFWTPPYAHGRVNTTAVPSTFPRRAVALHRLVVVYRRSAKACPFLCLSVCFINPGLAKGVLPSSC
jgi:hypothetical protein